MSSASVHASPDRGGVSRAGQIGALLILLGVIAVGAAVANGSVGIGLADGSGSVFNAGLALLGLGAVAFSVAPPRPALDRSARVALAVLALGLLSLAVSSIVGASMTTDPLESGLVVSALVIGMVGLPVGLGLVAVLVPRSAFRRR